MISNQILQSTIDGLKSISRTELGICDTEGKMLASTFPDDNRYEDAVVSFVASPADSQVISGSQFLRFLMSISWSISFLLKVTMTIHT